MTPSPSATTRVRVVVRAHDHVPDLSLADCDDPNEWAEAIEILLSAPPGSNTVQIALCPPVSALLSIPLAVVEVLRQLALLPLTTFAIDLLVIDEVVAARVRDVIEADSGSMRSFTIGTTSLRVVLGDIVSMRADAAVNASNTALRLGGGVSAAFRVACGPGLQSEMHAFARRHGLSDGDAVLTGPHGLRAIRAIIHVATASGTREAVSKAVTNTLRLCDERQFASVALPALGTGTGGMSIQIFSSLLLEGIVSSVRLRKYPREVLLVLRSIADADVVGAAIANAAIPEITRVAVPEGFETNLSGRRTTTVGRR